MEATLKIYVIMLLCFLLCNEGNASSAQCKVSDLAVTQKAVPGSVVGPYPEYTVVVENRCICTQSNVTLACHGFNSSVQVYPPEILRPDGDGELCTLDGGGAIGMGPSYAVKFSYAWSSQFSFKPVSSTIACSSAPKPL